MLEIRFSFLLTMNLGSDIKTDKNRVLYPKNTIMLKLAHDNSSLQAYIPKELKAE